MVIFDYLSMTNTFIQYIVGFYTLRCIFPRVKNHNIFIVKLGIPIRNFHIFTFSQLNYTQCSSIFSCTIRSVVRFTSVVNNVSSQLNHSSNDSSTKIELNSQFDFSSILSLTMHSSKYSSKYFGNSSNIVQNSNYIFFVVRLAVHFKSNYPQLTYKGGQSTYSSDIV